MKRLAFMTIAALALLCGCRSTGTFEPEWLPESASVVYSSEYEGNVRVKFKAKVTESEFVAATQRLNMIPHTEDAEYAANLQALRWKSGPNKRWDPLPASDGTFIFHRLHMWEMAKYENGFLYYR
jgi:hypothetical protein